MQLIYLIYISVILGIYKLSTIFDPDYFFHFYTGKYILDNQVIPTQDIFSWYPITTKWYTPSWLFDVMSYILKDGIIILLPILYSLLIFILLKLYFDKKDKIEIIKLLIFLFLIGTMQTFIQHRPTIFSFLFFGYMIYVLFNYINKDKKIYSKLLYTLPIIQILWVNFHGASSSLMYTIILMILIINIMMPFTLGNIKHEKLPKQKNKTLIIILIATLLCSLINPNTYEMFIFIFSNFTNTSLFASISELHSPTFPTIGRLITMFGPLIIVGFTFLVNKEKKFQLNDLILFLAFTCLYFKSARFFPYFIMMTIYIIGKYLDIKILEINTKIITKKIHKIAIIIILIITMGIISIKIYNANNKFINPINTIGYFSEDIVNKLVELQPERLANHFNTGSYLSYMLLKNNSHSKVLINGLAEIYIHTPVMDDSEILYSLMDNPEEIIKKYQFDYIVVNRYQSLYWYLNINDSYELIFQDNTGAIFKVLHS